MGELVLLVVAAAWAAVLIPPLLRSRMENRPNSSVTDFRRQLNKLQSTVPNRATGPMRGMARPLAQSPGYRQGGRAPVAARRAGTRTHGERTLTAAPAAQPRRQQVSRAHQGRPQQQRQAPAARHRMSAGEQLRRRRANVLFMLVATAGATLFLAATTKAPAMLYLFAISFLALCGYVYLLAQVRQRESTSWPTDWMSSERPVARRAYR
ncbi:MAG TPA: hypothetical protein VNQ73_07750 [Ilumatobacter sp.]|nr:hypothetical protein [Ilumatobacter sp.]